MNREEKVQTLASCKPLAEIPAEGLAALADASTVIGVEVGVTLIEEGSLARELFVLVKGALEVTRKQTDGEEALVNYLTEEEEGQILLGEMQALTGGVRTASVRTREPSTLLKLSIDALRELSLSYPVMIERIAALIRHRARVYQLQKVLSTESRTASEPLLDEIQLVVEWLYLSRGERLVSQGEACDAIYFLTRGLLVSDLGHYLPGESLGETVVLEHDTHAATVWAARDCEVARIPRGPYIALSEVYPELTRRALEASVRRQRYPNRKRSRLGARTVAVVPIGDQVPMSSLMTALLEALGEYTMPVYINRDIVVSRLQDPSLPDCPDTSPEALRLVLMLEQLEAESPLVVYEAGADLQSGWAQRCIRNADEVVLIGVAGNATSPSEQERALLEVPLDVLRPHTTLALLYPEGDISPPKHTACWLDHRNIQTVLHITQGHAEDFGRLARFVSGNAVGLVIAGGAAHGFAGYGVIEALEELGIPIDAVGGVSSGGLVSATYAAGISKDKTLRFILGAQNVFNLVSTATVPVLSMSSGHGLTRSMRTLFGDICIEDLRLPCFFVSTNMTRAVQKVSTRGDLVEHLKASNALPGMLPPVVFDGDLHVDGALVNNVPIEEMAEIVRGGPVIVVDVTPNTDLATSPTPKKPPGLGGWRVLKDRMLGRGEHASTPTILEIMMRAHLLQHIVHMRTAQPLASLYLQPDLSDYKLMQHFSARDIARAGYEQCFAQIHEWWTDHQTRSLNR